MNEISGLRARRDEIRQQLANAKANMPHNWDEERQRLHTNWMDLRNDTADAHKRFSTWDDARERRFVAHLDEAQGALRESAAQDATNAADVRGDFAAAQQELRDKAAAARQRYDAWRQQRKDANAQANLDDAELELEEASNRYAAAQQGASRRGAGRTSS
jgi:hypothetical protein